MRTAIYVRVSTAEQDCEQQRHVLREYVTARGWTIAGEFEDIMSGTKDSRPAMNQVMDLARQRLIDAVVVYKLDRWGRSMSHLVSSLQELESLGVRFVAPSQSIDTDASNPTGRLMVNLLASFSAFERELIVERTRMGLAKARRAGKTFGRPCRIVDRVKIQEARAGGMSLGAAARAFGISKSSAARICR